VALNIGDAPAGVALVPGAVELLGGGPKLHDEVAGNVLGLNLPPLLVPKADQSRLVAAHDNPGVGAADEGAALCKLANLQCIGCH
jgi:hypothetical protein